MSTTSVRSSARVDDAAAGLTAALRPWLPEPGSDRDHDAARVAGDHLELVAFADRCLMDVPADDQLRSRVDQLGEHVVPAGDRLLPRSPRRADQLVVQRNDAQSAWGRQTKLARHPLELRVADAPRLVPPGAHRIEADDVGVLADQLGLRCLPLALELAPTGR